MPGETYTEKKKASNNRYLSKFRAVSVRLSPEDLEKIKAAAEAAGESLAGFVTNAARDRAKGVGSGGPMTEGQIDAARAAAERAGTDVTDWIGRAIQSQVARDENERVLRQALQNRK